ncbi:hypothetical protein K432DRAFT_100003 [Lepidopterella palustris CBS 459.81]|uniref:DUF7702 domain-containing protein n=1 Tax=Lepidopterella palustris CBS 459.81 TaxID=1314670 RepID=A0A8E2JDM0_9PEZI|nr:hypothetical protein K432DRAFT_100003 [Lepidopterella palustris CBS 459.81]
MVLNAHGIVASFELAFYTLLLIPTVLNVFHFGVRQHTGWLFMVLFSLVKMTGAALFISTLTSSKTPSIGLQVAMSIMYQVALGPLLSATLSFFNGATPTTPPSTNRRRGSIFSNLPRLLRLIHFAIIAAIALGVIGGINRAPTSNGQINASKYDSGATYLKVSSVLLLVALVGIVYGLMRYWSLRTVMSEPQRSILPAIGAAIPLLLLRVIYSLLSSFNLNTSTSKGHTMAFNIFTGSIAAYIVLAMLPQIGVVVLYSVAGFVARLKSGKSVEVGAADGSNGKFESHV